MKHQTRPYTVEVKKKRGFQKGNGSIWADIDLAAFAGNSTTEPTIAGAPDHPFVGTSMPPVNAEMKPLPFVEEHFMADNLETEVTQSAPEETAKAGAPETEKAASQPRTTKAERKQSTNTKRARAVSPATEASASSTRRARKL
jgi:hypothetical protein